MAQYEIKGRREIRICIHSSGEIYLNANDIIQWMKSTKQNCPNDAELLHEIIETLIVFKNNVKP